MKFIVINCKILKILRRLLGFFRSRKSKIIVVKRKILVQKVEKIQFLSPLNYRKPVKNNSVYRKIKKGLNHDFNKPIKATTIAVASGKYIYCLIVFQKNKIE